MANRNVWITLFSLLAATQAWSQSAPPRTISDITALLEQHKPDPEKVKALQAAVYRPVPPDLAGTELVRFYLKRAEAAQAVGAISRQIADLRRAAELAKGSETQRRVLQDLWIAELYVGNIVDAMKLKERSLALFRSDPAQQIVDHSNMVMQHVYVGDLAGARMALQRLQALMHGDTWSDSLLGLAEDARGAVLETEGKYRDAESAHRNALAAKERFLRIAPRVAAAEGVPLERFYDTRDGAELRLAHNLKMQGRYGEAELAIRNVLQRALARLGRSAALTGRASAAFAALLNEQRRLDEAERMAMAAVDIQRSIGAAPESFYYVQARRALASALLMQSRWADALGVYRSMHADLARDPRALEKLGRGDVHWALALVKSGNTAEAREMLEDGIKQSADQLGPDHSDVAVQRGVLAMALANSGDRARALTEYRAAVRVLVTPSALDAGGDRFSPAQQWRLSLILEGYIRLLFEMREVTANPDFDVASETFHAADALRGHTVQGALAASAARAAAATPELAQLVRREQDAKRQITVLNSALLRLLGAPPEQQLPKVASQIRERIRELGKEQQGLAAEVAKRFPSYADLVSPRPATLEQAQGALREGEVLISVLTTEARTYVWALPKHGAVALHAAELGEREVGRIVAGLRRALDPGEVALDRFPEFDVAGAQRLYAQLLQPVEGSWKGAQTLLVVANGALAQLPFGVLPVQATATAAGTTRFAGYKSVPWLMRSIAVTQLPAVNTLVTLRSLPQGNAQRSAFAGFGDPDFGGGQAAGTMRAAGLAMRNLAVMRSENGKTAAQWSRYNQLSALPDTREEILAMAQALKADPQKDVFLGAQANKQNVKAQNLATRRIVAFATHGLIPGDFPNLDEPALALSAPDGKTETGLLTLEDILQLKLDADWVVLSACNTAAGDGAGADAISGLGKGFFYAGSRALLVTHWPVETRSARQLVTTLFERYTADPKLSRAEALRQASLAVMQDGAKDASGNTLYSYAHPIFWAPYALVGDGAR